MNIRLILKTLSKILFIQGAYMLMSLAVALYYGESITPFVIPIVGMVIIALPFFRMKVRKTIFSARDGLVCVAFIWLAMSFFGAIPFFINGGFGTFVDCFFESVSGFTTTGASVLRDIESLPKGILFWRSSTHWLGGMGILVLALALFPSIGERAQNLMAAESPGPTSEKLTSRISSSSKILYMIYAGITILETFCLRLADFPWYDSIVTSFATAGTGGFSVLNNSIAGYNNLAAEIIITIFTVLYGINFSIFFLLLTGQIKKVLKNSEFKFYISAIVIFVTLITINVYSIYQSIGQA
ncbi:MAG: TrkH family potassium uptake protein, partial [Clostridia bacterium]|nr:TrkH family potassium uptake protein [Clostridia bacterium]